MCRDDLDLRVYSSNLLGESDELVLHGGGNTSVKMDVDGRAILYVKGSGWDLVSIKREGFSPVKMSALMRMAKLTRLSDSEMVAGQKIAMIDETAPNPSVEAILHALIPFKVVDHTHADAIVTISNSINGQKHIEKLFPNFLIIPYVMPGFILAQTIYTRTESADFDWESCEGIILHNHGIFTFDNDAKKSYDKMIEAVGRAENFLEMEARVKLDNTEPMADLDIDTLGELMSEAKGYEVFMRVNQTPLALTYASQKNLSTFATRGVLTPEHIIRTKREPLVLENANIKKANIKNANIKKALEQYKKSYLKYFEHFAKDEIMLNPAPNYAVVKDFGIVLFGKSSKEVDVLNDVIEHTMMAVLRADKLGGFVSIGLEDSFEMEYWELEQAKLK
jgi:rhamnose utilization protein RhaD (predicted bifunctional aldolase and dehydrogenase)